jgi:virulence factor Mce-like protein
MSRLRRVVISLSVLVVLVAGTVTLIRASNGDYSGDYKLSGLFAKAGEGLPPGAEVVFRGVQVGRVSSADLHGDVAKVTVLMDPNFNVPADATATIEPVNLFGADEVSLSTPGHDGRAGPYLARNGSFAHTANSDELGDLFAAATPLLQKIDTNNLSTVLGELGQASQGEGPSIARSISAGTRLADALNTTLSAQENALDSFARLAESRGQIRNTYVQNESGNQGSVYVVDDQVYANNKITTPQSDVLRVVVDLQKVGSVWKISDVTVLEGATPASTGTPSGSAGSTVPGQ